MSFMDASWLIDRLADASVRAVVIAGVAAIALAAFRVRHAAFRLSVWTAVLYASLAMPFLSLLLPPIPLRVASARLDRTAAWMAQARAAWQSRNAPQYAASDGAGQASWKRASSADRAAAAFASAASEVSPVTHSSAGASIAKRPDLDSGRALVPALTKQTADMLAARWQAQIASLTGAEIALSIYALVLAILFGRVAIGALLGHRLRLSARRIDDRDAARWLRWHALAMGVERVPVLMESAAVSVPLTLGVWRPVILLPGGWRVWPAAKLSAVIAHELSHVRRKDSRTRALAVAYRSIFWFSPLGWWLQGYLAALSEQASDLAAIGAGAEPTYYAEVLMSFFGAVRTSGARVDWQGIAMARPGGRAHDRIEKVLASPATLPGRRKARLLTVAALVAVPVVCLMAMTRPVLVASPSGGQSIVPPPSAPPAPAAAPLPPVPPDHLMPPPALLSPGAPAQAPRARLAPGPALPAPHAFLYAGAASLAPVGPYPAPAPRASAAPGLWQQPVPPEAPEAPEPPQARDDGDWMINNTHHGMTFAIVSGKSVMMNGSDDDADTIRGLRKKIGSDFIWFVHNGNSYVIRDSAIVKNAEGFYAGMDELGRQQDELGRQQDELGGKQDELGRQQDAVRVKVPADLDARLKKVEDDIRRLGPTASQDDLGRLQGELGDLQGYLGDLQGKAGDAQGELGHRQGELGAQQGELGRKQGELGRRQGEVAREASRKMQDVIRQALANGKAERAPE